MGFVETQIIIFLSIIIASLIGGKKGTIVSIVVWGLETIIIYKISSINYLQIVTIAVSFQFGLIIGILKDAIVKMIKKKKEIKN